MELIFSASSCVKRVSIESSKLDSGGNPTLKVGPSGDSGDEVLTAVTAARSSENVSISTL
jgi:hypothetical protein